MASGFSLSGWFGKSKPAPGALLEAVPAPVAVRSVRRRRWALRAAGACAVAVVLLVVAFDVSRWQRLAEAAAMCPLVQTNMSSRRGIDPGHEFWMDARGAARRR